jgi:hypothetical protein
VALLSQLVASTDAQLRGDEAAIYRGEAFMSNSGEKAGLLQMSCKLPGLSPCIPFFCTYMCDFEASSGIEETLDSQGQGLFMDILKACIFSNKAQLPRRSKGYICAYH